MAYFDYQDLTSNLPFLKEFDYIEVQQTLNHHARLLVRGLVDEQEKDDCVKRAGSEQMIQISGRDGKVLFTGLIENIVVKAVNQVYYVEIQGISYSFLMDVKKVKKSYQNAGMTYEEILNEKMAQYFQGGIINTVGSGQAIGSLIVQYQETDWEFLKRLASHFNQPLVAGVRQAGAKLFFGVPDGKTVGQLTNFNYEVECNISRYLLSSENNNQRLGEADTMEYTITTDQDFDLGDRCTFQHLSLLIKEKQVFYREGMLSFHYKLSPENGLSQDGIFCEAIRGVSLKGCVLQSIGDKVKVHLEIDPEQDPGTAWLFPYATPYTAQGNTGWYCMPESGDTVQIYFPETVEAKAIGLNSVRTGSASGDKISDPGVKYFRTANGKELKFSQDEILITCVNGKDPVTGEEKCVYIRLNQDDGIEIVSTDSIYLKSEKKITLDAEESIRILADEEVRFKCKTSEIVIDSKIDICGEVVKVN